MIGWLSDHWPWLATPAGAAVSWLARRRIGSSWRSLSAFARAHKRLADCQNDRADWESERTDLSRRLAEAIAWGDSLSAALKEITEAARLVKEARETGTLQTVASDGGSGSTRPATSPPSSGTSPPTPAAPTPNR